MVTLQPTRELTERTRVDDSYWTFYDQVASRQLAAWLATSGGRILDLSGDGAPFAEQMAAAGHEVVHVSSALPEPDGVAGAPAAALMAAPLMASPDWERRPGGVLRRLIADGRSLDWLADGSVDAVVAEQRALSYCLATELTLDELARVLRPGGRLLLCVDSLLLGLARLAEAGRWAELADAPSADVVLVPNDDGTITRCFWPEELHAVLADAGFDVEWIRPRTVLSREAVERAMGADPRVLTTLVETELALANEREGESIGVHLLASAVRRS